jgi:hypothetical protein
LVVVHLSGLAKRRSPPPARTVASPFAKIQNWRPARRHVKTVDDDTWLPLKSSIGAVRAELLANSTCVYPSGHVRDGGHDVGIAELKV